MSRIFLNITLLISLLSTACNSDTNKQKLAAAVILPPATSSTEIDSIVYESESLTIRKIGNHVYQHTSFLNTESFGKVPCNGMIVANDQEAIVFDTPTDNKSSDELIQYFLEEGFEIMAVISTHFHSDCVGGLEKFHESNIPSYASNRTISSLKDEKSEFPHPQNGFENLLELKVGDKEVYAEYFGEGHTKDNVIGYFPEEKVIFGGCLVKEKGAGKGNLEDANVKDWPETVKKIKAKYPQTKIIIPGHGQSGGTELLDYTIKLFE